ncbi:excitatory amino acid transporter 1-like isoform X3 [Tachypleus tridentatus]|uniref:excitatory amino acid transporter 1-like isoform X3 n=1 Tax=Tachypleus tridentatus TaxID=6853 RepID=UPI003FCF826E
MTNDYTNFASTSRTPLLSHRSFRNKNKYPMELKRDTIVYQNVENEDTQKNKEIPHSKCLSCIKINLLAIMTFLAVIVGIALGFGLRYTGDWTPRQIMYINYPGELFLRMLQCLILPLIVTSLVSALGTLDTRLSGKIGARSIVYYMCTTVLAIILGVILVVVIHPGAGNSKDIARGEDSVRLTTTEDSLMDLLRNMFPPNIIQACMQQFTTVIIPPESSSTDEKDLKNMTGEKNNSKEISKYSWKIRGEYNNETNILGVVVFSVVLGVTLAKMGEKGKPLLDVFITLGEAIMIITKWVIWLSPAGIIFLIAAKMLEMEDFSVLVGQLGLYTATVILGLFLHAVIILPVIYSVVTRSLPFRFMSNMMQAIATAFGTASSVTATASSIGAAGIPQAGLITLVIVLNVIGLPAEDATLIIIVDWLLDRLRTAVNVLGDAFGAGIVAHLSKDDLKKLDEEQKHYHQLNEENILKNDN